MMLLDRFLIAYTVLPMRVFDITAEQIERTKRRDRRSTLRPEGISGMQS